MLRPNSPLWFAVGQVTLDLPKQFCSLRRYGQKVIFQRDDPAVAVCIGLFLPEIFVDHVVPPRPYFLSPMNGPGRGIPYAMRLGELWLVKLYEAME